jgi:hypothetical protein
MLHKYNAYKMVEPPIASCGLMLVSMNLSTMMISSLTSRVTPRNSIDPFSKAASTYSNFIFFMSVWISLKFLLPFSFAPNTGRLGLASRMIYFYGLGYNSTCDTLSSSSMYFIRGLRLSSRSYDLWMMVRLIIGCFSETFFTSRSFLPVVTIC